MPPRKRYRVGEVRPTQVIHTYGVGALVDLPNFTVIVQGLQDWNPPGPEHTVVEERLLSVVRSFLGAQVEKLILPPVPPTDSSASDPSDPEHTRGVPVTPFPRWVRCPICNLIAPLNHGVFRLQDNPWSPIRTCYVHSNCAKSRGRPPAVVPVRFVVACERGHIDDFPWVEYIHGGPTECAYALRLFEFGVSAEAADIVVKCETCDTSRPMTQAFMGDAEALLKALGKCTGCHPHLRIDFTECEAPRRAMLAGASNIWFAVSVQALSVPTGGTDLGQSVKARWGELKDVSVKAILKFLRTQGKLGGLAAWSDDEIWGAIEAERAGAGREATPKRLSELKADEWEIFTNPTKVPKSADFELTEVQVDRMFEAVLQRVVAVERLRVVKALTGFTRITSPGDYIDPSEIPEIRRVALSRKRPEWVPASVVRGEGLFVQLREDTLAAWEAETTVREREAEFRAAHIAFRRARKIPEPEKGFPGIRYVLLHSLAHSLIRQFSVECGYSAASIQERIYAAAGETGRSMAGLLLYTAAPDSEGTLGGLVGLGETRTLARHLEQALEALRLCASDPLCSEHTPGQDGLTLHGAACHACMFVAETSCERGNKYLDRDLLVKTFGGSVRSFFDRGESR